MNLKVRIPCLCFLSLKPREDCTIPTVGAGVVFGALRPYRIPMPWKHKSLSDAQFRGEHFRRITSPDWRHTFRPATLRHFAYHCAVCGLDYEQRGITRWQLQVDHKYYRKNGQLIFCRETFDDVRVVCPTHHPKGTRSEFTMGEDRAAYRDLKILTWLCLLPFRMLRWAGRTCWRLLRRR